MIQVPAFMVKRPLHQQRYNEVENDNKKNTYAQNREEIAEIPWTHNEERGIGKLNSYRDLLKAREIGGRQ